MSATNVDVVDAVSAALAGAVAGRADVADALATVCDTICGGLGLVGAAIALVDDEGPRPAAAAGGVEPLVGLAQVDPAVPWPAAPSTEPVSVADVAAAGLPAHAVVRLTRHGVRAVHDIPLRADGTVAGVLRLLAGTPGDLERAAAEQAQALGRFLGALVFALEHLEQARALAAQLDRALGTRVVIEQAKGVLAASDGRLGEPQAVEGAFEALRRYARAHQRRVHDVATAVVEGSLDPATVLEPTS